MKSASSISSIDVGKLQLVLRTNNNCQTFDHILRQKFVVVCLLRVAHQTYDVVLTFKKLVENRLSYTPRYFIVGILRNVESPTFSQR